MDRPRVVAAAATAFIALLILTGVNAVYTNYRIEKNNKLIEMNQLDSNRNFCDLFDEILTTARPGAFKDRIAKIYNAPQYRCSEIKK